MIGEHHRGTPPRRVAVLAVVLCLLAACADDAGSRDGVAPSGPGSATTTSRAGASGDPSDAAPDGACPDPEADLAGFTSATVATPGDGGSVESCLLVADTLAGRQQGLMGVTDLGPFDGMLFAYEDASTGDYWMRDTPMPLSIAWIAPDGEVVGTADMEPCLDAGATCPTYGPGDAAYRWAVEVPQGGLPDLGLDVGVLVDVTGWPTGRG